MWQYRLVDTFTAVNFVYNVGMQHSSIVIGAMADGNFTKLSNRIFEPIYGFAVSHKFIKAAKNFFEKQSRVATIATLLLASGT